MRQFCLWKCFVTICAGSLGLLGCPRELQADIFADWNNQELTQIRTTSLDPLYASRDLAILQIAMFDAINGVSRQDSGFYVTQDAPPGASMGAAMAAVGLRVMTVLYGSNSNFTTLYNSQIASLADSPTAVSQGITWGTSVANTILNSRGSDGASTSNTSYSATNVQGDWAPTPPAFTSQPLRPGWQTVTPFALNTGEQFRPNGPETLDSVNYAGDFAQVKSLGQDSSTTRTADHTSIASFWTDLPGTVTTPGHWNQALQTITTGYTLNDKAKAFAAVNIAMADAAIAAWDAKYTYQSWRPVTAIRDEATRDTGVEYNNPNITGDETWTPFFASPNAPEYVSLHSTQSQAAATVLAYLLAGDVHSFTLTADTNGDGTADIQRNFTSFSQAAIEAGRAGIYGGYQFNSSIQDGHALGDNVGQYVDNYFTPIVTNTTSTASLSSLALGAGTLSPSFGSGTLFYNATVTNSTSSITVTPTVAQPNSTVTVNGVSVTSGTASGPISLSLGGNDITVVVTAEDATTTRTYAINVTRATAPIVTTLAATNITSGGAKLNGTVDANGATTTVTFEYGLTASYGSVATATQSPLFGSGNTAVSATLSGLGPGVTYHYRVKAVSGGGTTYGYDVTFNTLNNLATLSSLVPSAGTLSPAFTSLTTSYTSSVPNTTASLTVTPTVSQAQATVTVNGTAVNSGAASGDINLNVGSNTITIVVTAQDGTTTKTYTLNVTRAPLTPEIVVEQPVGTGLVDGSGSVSLGNASVPGGSSSLTFTISNIGAADLTGISISKNGAHAAEFSISAPGATTVAAGNSTTFTVTFAPTAAGARSAAIHIASNDADESPFDINLTGTGVQTPEIAVEQPAGTNLVDNTSTIDFGTTPTTAPVTKTFTIKNTGLASLSGVGVTVDGTDAALFSVTANPAATVNPAGSTTFIVSFNPTTQGSKTAALHIASNDADENPFDIALQGNGIPAPGSLSFDGTGFTVNETDGTINIPLKRTGGNFGSVTVNVSTVNDTATSGTGGDFTALTNFPVTFPDGVLTGSVSVSIANSSSSEVNETFKVVLSSPTGNATLGSPSSAPVTIIDSSSLPSGNDTAPPGAPVILTPALNKPVGVPTNGTTNISGTASDIKGVKKVQVKLNNGAFTDANLGTPGAPVTTFSLAVTPLTGSNTIQVMSIDYANKESVVVSRTFITQRPLVVNTNTSMGTVTTGFSPSSYREVGKSCTIIATPVAAAAPGFAFNGWTISGGPTAGDIGVTPGALEMPTLVFTFREGLVLTANFIPNPFSSAITGAYNGLILPSDTLPAPGVSVPSNETVGKVTANVMGTGSFSGTLFIDGMSLGFQGVFDNSGTGRFGTNRATKFSVVRTIKPSYDLTLNIDLSPGGTNKITGTLTQRIRSVIKSISNLDADRAFYNGTTVKVPANLAGTSTKAYTVALPAKGLGSQPAGFALAYYPQGDGYATGSININGTVSVAGKLADGTAFSSSAPLSKNNTWPLFQSLYPVLKVNKGCIAGQITVDDTQPETDMAGTDLIWFRPFQLVQWYPFGWDEGIRVDLMGAKYVVPAVTPPTSVFPGPGPASALKPEDAVNGNVEATFCDGLLSGSCIRKGNVSTSNVGSKPSSNTDAAFTLTITPTTGFLTGTFTHTDATKPTFLGVIIQKGTQRGAYGYFLTKQPAVIDYSGESGGVSLIGLP